MLYIKPAGLAKLLLIAIAVAGPACAEDHIKVFIRSIPDGAYIYRRAGTEDSVQFVGKVNQILLLDPTELPPVATFYLCGQPQDKSLLAPMPKTNLPDYSGYKLSKFDLDMVQRPIDKDEPDVYYFPPRGDGDKPLQIMSELPGVGNAILRWKLWATQHLLLVGALVAGVILPPFVVILMVPQWRERAAFRRKQEDFNERLMSQNLDNDQYIGRSFANWISTTRIGQGGMAVVYKGIPADTLDENDAVAIKVMSDAVARDAEYRKRFEREIKISRDLDNTNVVRLIDWGNERGVLYLVMEYIQGQTLRDILPERGFMLPRALELMLAICAGMIYAHKQGVVHRDLKPDNIMVTSRGLVKIMDLGLAKREESENVTKTGDTFGTPAYMAPEQIAGGQLTPQTDQYALGVILFELLTGRRPFDVADSLTMVMKHLNEPPPLVRTFKPQLPPELEEIVNRMLAKDPTRRLANLVEVKTRLEKVRQTYVGAGPLKGEEKPGTPQEGRPTRVDPRKTIT